MEDYAGPEDNDIETLIAPFMAELTLMRVQEQLTRLWQHAGVPLGPDIRSTSVSFLLLHVQQPNGIPTTFAVQSERVSSFLIRNPLASAQYIHMGMTSVGRTISVQTEPIAERDLGRDYFYDYEPDPSQLTTLKDGVNGPLINNVPTSLAHDIERTMHTQQTALEKVAHTVACLQQASIVF